MTMFHSTILLLKYKLW